MAPLTTTRQILNAHVFRQTQLAVVVCTPPPPPPAPPAGPPACMLTAPQAHRGLGPATWERLPEGAVRLADAETTRTAVHRALAAGRHAGIVDVDDALDDPSLDWRNEGVAAWLSQA
jgi:hypothetical protein